MKPSYEELLLVFNQLVKEGLDIITNNRGLSQEELEGELKKWIDKCKTREQK